MSVYKCKTLHEVDEAFILNACAKKWPNELVPVVEDIMRIIARLDTQVFDLQEQIKKMKRKMAADYFD
jgi:hypothetical protein